ncbi:MAG: 50S ribosomal protein L28 [Verrucomicrobia bacterium]|nr:MAG: 50S ribosomal protein L28 [Verrucomicrobiota bacterium]
MKVCHITGSRAMRGSVIHRRGLAKKKGGVGRHITKMVPRIFAPNLRHQRIWVPELKKFVRVRVTARGLKTINKHGAYSSRQISCSGQDLVRAVVASAQALAAASASTVSCCCFDLPRGRSSEPSLNSIT